MNDGGEVDDLVNTNISIESWLMSKECTTKLTDEWYLTIVNGVLTNNQVITYFSNNINYSNGQQTLIPDRIS